MAQMSDYLEDSLINHTFRGVTMSSPTTIYAALYSTDPTDADTGNELTGSGYSRVAISLDAPIGGVSSNGADIIFPIATADWLPVTHIGIRDATTGGNLLMHKVLASSVTVLNTNNFRIPAGQLTIAFA